MPERKPIKVAIVGGGCGAISAAFELTRPEQQGRFDVTVYQLGWRLGGKGASGRGPRWRIEEHALHVWLGFYENAFRMLRECHAELGSPNAWRNDFIEDSFIALAGGSLAQDAAQSSTMTAAAWASLFPPTPGLPGDPFVGESNPFAVMSYVRQALRLLRKLVGGLSYLEKDPERGFVDKDFLKLDPGPDPESPRNTVRRALEGMLRMWKLGFLSSTAGILTSITLIERLLGVAAQSAGEQRAAEAAASGDQSATAKRRDTGEHYLVVEVVETFAAAVRGQLSGMVKADAKFALRWQIMDLVLAIIVGTVRDGLFAHPDGLDAINNHECREWLRRYGASEESVSGPFVTGLYHLGFANEAGVAAGQALRGALRMFFTYRGAMFWKMRAGMGDVVFAPLYEVLKRRGVRFEFFHRLENVGMTFPEDGAAPYVSSLRFDVQTRLKAHAYDPLVRVKGRSCWPSKPDWLQLAEGDSDAFRKRDLESFYDRQKEATKTLRVCKDFDYVVLGVSKGAIKYVCGEILGNKGPIGKRWRDMVEKVPTTATQAFQVWLRADMAKLGWHDQSVTLTGMSGGFDTWSDMRQVIPAEDWPRGQEPLTVAYFCGPLGWHPADSPPEVPPEDQDSKHPAERLALVRRNARTFLETRMVQLWTHAGSAGAFDWSLLVDPTGHTQRHKEGAAALASQYIVANINPSDQYVLAPAGSIKYRISPLDTGIDNMTIAGDWTACGFTEGCVEAAVMSGKLASHAISLLPKLEDIIGYDHP